MEDNLIKEKSFKDQVAEGQRFEFGKNWNSFLETVTPERIKVAEESLKNLLGEEDLKGSTFLDIGCGSGLFSLGAKNLNAKVHSLDFDINSVNCAKILKEKFHPNSEWTVEEASILDKAHISTLGKFDIVYSWGVLHHTGNMYLALENAAIPVAENGKLSVAIYNDEGFKSRVWLKIKKLYNMNFVGKSLVTIFFFALYMSIYFCMDLFRLKNPFKRYAEYKIRRGMSMFHDWHDWLGGLPFEVAKPEEIFKFYSKKGFILENMITTNRLGCNEFVFKKVSNRINKLD